MRRSERGRSWGVVLYQDPWVECIGVPRLGLDWLIQAKRVGFAQPYGGLITRALKT